MAQGESGPVSLDGGRPDQAEDHGACAVHHGAEAAPGPGAGLDQPRQAAAQLAPAPRPADQDTQPGRSGLHPHRVQPQHLQLSPPPGNEARNVVIHQTLYIKAKKEKH